MLYYVYRNKLTRSFKLTVEREKFILTVIGYIIGVPLIFLFTAFVFATFRPIDWAYLLGTIVIGIWTAAAVKYLRS
jgi:hypothetical protein